MSKTLALVLVVVGIVLIVAAVIEHFAVSTLLIPHLGIYLIVLGVILGGLGAWGMMRARAA